ncbi:hypothetical protein IFM89_032508 [Coptis chinensis]|uniref:N-acetyltransferase domain-containing protein n=1 Tax=Coptis chinensis TaxID=261450 RepID=A0A835IS59_9MAGN|nr:hypothetical protein IFM89_032508 [Coptis chinensis]
MGREVMECTKIQAEITLQPFELSDVDDFMDWARNNEVTKYCRWNTYTSKEEAVNFLKEVISLHPWYRAICVDNRSIGFMPSMDKNQRRGEIGYALSSKYWGSRHCNSSYQDGYVLCIERHAISG